MYYSKWFTWLSLVACVSLTLTGLLFAFHPKLKEQPSYPLIGITCLVEAILLHNWFAVRAGCLVIDHFPHGYISRVLYSNFVFSALVGNWSTYMSFWCNMVFFIDIYFTTYNPFYSQVKRAHREYLILLVIGVGIFIMTELNFF